MWSSVDDVGAGRDHRHHPKGASPGMVEQLRWNVQRLIEGSEISERKR